MWKSLQAAGTLSQCAFWTSVNENGFIIAGYLWTCLWTGYHLSPPSWVFLDFQRDSAIHNSFEQAVKCVNTMSNYSPTTHYSSNQLFDLLQILVNIINHDDDILQISRIWLSAKCSDHCRLLMLIWGRMFQTEYITGLLQKIKA